MFSVYEDEYGFTRSLNLTTHRKVKNFIQCFGRGDKVLPSYGNINLCVYYRYLENVICAMIDCECGYCLPDVVITLYLGSELAKNINKMR